MLEGWPESQSTSSAPPIPFPQFDSSTNMRGGVPMSSSRQRTSLACDKCRERKTKCTGEKPVCARCTARGLICTYSCREPRSRGPSRPRTRPNPGIQLPLVTPIPKSVPLAPLKLPEVELPRATAVQQRISRPMHYRVMSMPQRPTVLPARTHAKTSSFAGYGYVPDPARHYLSQDLSQPQSRRLGPSMFSSAPVAQPMDAAQITSFSNFGSAARVSFNSNSNHNLPNFITQVPDAASLNYGAFDQQLQALQGSGQLSLDSNNGWGCSSVGNLGCVDRSTPPLSHSTGSSVTHSPSTSSDHDREAHHQGVTHFQRLMASFADPGFYQRCPGVPQAPTSDVGAGPFPFCFKVGGESSPSSRLEYHHVDANVELQYPTPLTPIGMEKLEADGES